MTYGIMPDELFRELTTKKEKTEFLDWTHENWERNKTPSPLWHPLVRQEWKNMNDLAHAVDSIYQGCAPDILINVDPLASGAKHTTIGIIADSLDTHMAPPDLELWQKLPTKAKDTILNQAIGDYF